MLRGARTAGRAPRSPTPSPTAPGRAPTWVVTDSPATSWRSRTGCTSDGSSRARHRRSRTAYAEGRVGSLDRYRGRSCDPFPVQAAERAVREHLGLDRIDDVAPVDVRRRGERAEVVFTTPMGAAARAVGAVAGTADATHLPCHRRAVAGRVDGARDRSRGRGGLAHEPPVDGDRVAGARRSVRAQ